MQNLVSDEERARLEAVKFLRESGQNPYKNGYSPSALSVDLHLKYDSKSKEELEAAGARCSVAGRVMAIRDFGKAGFLRLKDRAGIIQIFAQKNALGDEGFAQYRGLHAGDIVFSEGALFKTKTNELSVHADRLELLTKALRPLPEKFHGISDIEIKYRQRYLDLIADDKSRETFLKRFKIVTAVREFFLKRDFFEVETPMMHSIAGGASARPFVTHHNTLDLDLYLRIAPELYLKRLVVGGFERVFEINRNFRNEGISIKHNPEFTMLEFYQAYATYEDLMTLTEELFLTLADQVLGCRTLTYAGTEIHFEAPWERLSVEEAVLKHSGFKDREKLRDRGALLAYGKSKGIAMSAKDPTGALLMAIFDEEVEQKLVQPTFVTQFPLDVSPLARRNEKDPFVTDRFELIIYGREMANAFSELNDPLDQRERFLAQVEQKKAGNLEACDMDEDYVVALEHGMPPTAGEGIGIDRLVMLFTDAQSIRDVILFPQLRPSGRPETS